MTISPDQRQKQEPDSSIPFVGSDFSDQTYRRISDILKEQQGFVLDGYKDLCIKRRIASRIRAVGNNTIETYIELLETSSKEQQQLLAALSIHVSHFFRNPSTFAVLEKQVLPELWQRAQRNKTKLRVWSVGCAGGEEPFSIALLCQELLSDGEQLSIIGTDMSSEVIHRAKQGRFRKERLGEVPAALLGAYFQPLDGEYQLIDLVREKVNFFQHDIVGDQPLYRSDLILCRNLLIYFFREQQLQILRMLATALSPGGYLVLGRAETLVATCRELFTCVDPAERIYQRLENSDQLLPIQDQQQLMDNG